MGMAQSSPRPSTRGLTRSLKVNLPTPCDLKTAYATLLQPIRASPRCAGSAEPMPTIDLPDDELAAVVAAIRRAIEDDNIPTIEDLCRAGGVDGYVRARVDQAVAELVAEVSKRARIEALEDCKRVLDAYDPDGPFKIIASGPSCREELRGEDITDIIVAGERRALRRRLCPKPTTDELRAQPRERVRRYRTRTPDERYVIREAREFYKRVRDQAELRLAEQQA